MALSLDTIAALAPDPASLAAARSLLKPASWPVRATDGAGLAWGECQGSGSAPYRISLSVDDLGYKCTCPSRKFPCKHTLALFWQLADRPNEFARSAPPDWVADWAARRKPKAAPTAIPGSGAGLAPAPDAAEPPQPRDEQAEARAAAQRERLRAQREDSILAGLDEFDRWLADRLEAGLSGFAAIAHEQCRLLARRLADAKAPGLALMLDELPATLLSLGTAERVGWLIEALGRLHLIAAAYRRQAALPPALREDVRRLVGWTTDRAQLLGDARALSVSAPWRVVATLATPQVDGLRRLETWLARGDPVPAGEPGFALLLDFVPASQAFSTGFVAGESLVARLVFHPSASPLRAVVAERGAAAPGPVPLPADPGIGAALDRWESVLSALPFVERWPLAIAGVTVLDTEAGLVLAEPDSTLALPIPRSEEDGVLPLIGRTVTVAGLWDGRAFRPLAADTGIGPWYQDLAA